MYDSSISKAEDNWVDTKSTKVDWRTTQTLRRQTLQSDVFETVSDASRKLWSIKKVQGTHTRDTNSDTEI